MNTNTVPINEPIVPEPTEPLPTEDQLFYWMLDSIVDSTDGCQVEPDGYCQHGYPSWLLQMGLI